MKRIPLAVAAGMTAALTLSTASSVEAAPNPKMGRKPPVVQPKPKMAHGDGTSWAGRKLVLLSSPEGRSWA